MAGTAGEEARGAGASPDPKPFLRRGSGWQARMAAAREGRRYVPRGGPIKDYSKEQELPARFRACRGRAAAAASVIPPSSAKAAALPGVAAGASGSIVGRRAAASAAASPARAQRQPAAGLPSVPAARARRQAVQPLPNGRPPAANTGSSTAALTSNCWAPKLLAACSMPAAAASAQQQAQRGRQTRQSQEEEALQEFEVLESQVLCEVGNSPRCLPRRGAKARASGSRCSGSTHSWPAAAAHAWPGCDVVSLDEESVSRGDGNTSCQGEAALVPGWAETEAGTGTVDAGSAHPPVGRVASFGALAPGAAAAHQPHPELCFGGPVDEEAEMEAHSSFVQDHCPLPSQPGFVEQQQQLFSSREAAPPAATGAAWHQPNQPWPHRGQLHQHAQVARQPPLPNCKATAVEQLQQEVVRLQEERARVARLRLELEGEAARMEAQQAAWEKRKVDEAARYESQRAEELRKLQRDRRVLEKQSRAILKMPTKQSKEEVAAVEALLAEERRTGRAREARHKLATERLRQQVAELQGRNDEMREQIRHLEQQRLEQQAWAASSRGTAPTAADPAAPAEVQAPAVGGKAAAAQPAAGRLGLPPVRVERGGRSSEAGAGGAAAGGTATSLDRHAEQTGRSPAADQVVAPSSSAALAPAAGPGAQEEGEEDAQIADVALEEEEIIECFWNSAAGDGQQLMPPAAGPRAGSQQPVPQPAGHTSGLSGPTAGAALPGPAATGDAAAAAALVMDKAGSALARFEQLRASLAQHEGVQQLLASCTPGQQASPQLRSQPGLPAAASAPGEDGFVAAPAAVKSGSSDDLRRLGRALLASGSEDAAVSLALGEPHPDSDMQEQGHQPAALAPLPGTPGDALVAEVQQADGRWERTYASGLREQHFSNGSTKQQLPGGGAALTRFANGDAKKALPCGTVEYYYAEVASWQVTHPSGVEVFFFPSGQVEAHHLGGAKEILFPDGAARKVLPDGRELPVGAAHLSCEIQRPRPVLQLVG
ncbi:hypothetical protein ABPG77_005290 [Micractinium sp. CCAP 211/92]